MKRLLAVVMAPWVAVVPRAGAAQTSVTISLFYGSGDLFDRNGSHFVCSQQQSRSHVDAVELTTHIPKDLATKICNDPSVDPRVCAATTYQNLYYWTGPPNFTDDQLLHNPQHLNADSTLYQDLTTTLCPTCIKYQVSDTGDINQGVRIYTLANNGTVYANLFERDIVRICNSP